MKKLLSLIISVVVVMSFGFYVNADESKTITLSPGWNVASTPAILSSIEFSNQGEGISFSKLSKGAWISVPATIENIKPLEGFMVYSSNSDDVTMTLNYKTGVTPAESMLQKNLDYGWNLLGITTTTSPFNNIGAAATMSVDFTSDGSLNNLNKIITSSSYNRNSTFSSINNPQLGEAYGIFINQQNAVYGGVNGGNNGGNTDCGSTFSDEVTEAYDWAYQKGMISESPITSAGLCNQITRAELAKALVALERKRGKYPDSSVSCSFTDISGLDSDLATVVKEACQLGIMGQGEDRFRPNANISQAEYGIILSRMLRGDQYNGGDPEYSGHLNALKAAGIMGKIDNAESTPMIKSSVLLTLIKADKVSDYVDCDDPVVKAACLLGADACPSECILPTGILENNLTQDVEFPQNETNRKVVFDGRYTAQDGDIYLNEVTFSGTKNSDSDITFYLVISGNEVTSVHNLGEESFKNIKVASGKSVSIKVEAEIHSTSAITYSDFSIKLHGESIRRDIAGIASGNLATIKVVPRAESELIISSTEAENTVLVKGNNQSIANFVVSPSGDEDVEFYSLVLSGNVDGELLTPDKIRVKVDGSEVGSTSSLTYDIDATVDSKGLKVLIELKNGTGIATLDIVSINGKPQNITFKKRFEDAVVYVSKQEDSGYSTDFTLNVEKSDDNIKVSNFKIYTDDNENYGDNTEIEDGYDFEVHGTSYTQVITKISYDVTVRGGGDGPEKHTVEILKSEYPDFFKVGNTFLKIFKA